jgi:hypothetical protein
LAVWLSVRRLTVSVQRRGKIPQDARRTCTSLVNPHFWGCAGPGNHLSNVTVDGRGPTVIAANIATSKSERPGTPGLSLRVEMPLKAMARREVMAAIKLDADEVAVENGCGHRR